MDPLDISIEEFVLLAASNKVALAIFAIIMGVMATRWLDRRSKLDFRLVRETIMTDSIATAIYYGARIFAVLIAVAMIVGCAPAKASMFPDRYDAQIEKAVDQWWPDYPHWRAWKAQLYQESLLDPMAVSPVGARGLAQFMPGTWAEVAKTLHLTASPHDDVAIEAGAFYMARLRHGWSSPRPQGDRHKLAQASYNAGFGNLLKAQRLCNGAVLYDDIVDCLPKVTGRHARETTTYVRRIARWWAMMESGL